MDRDRNGSNNLVGSLRDYGSIKLSFGAVRSMFSLVGQGAYQYLFCSCIYLPIGN